MYTAFHDERRCFAETLAMADDDDGTMGGRSTEAPRRADWVLVRGGWFPREIAGKARALCAAVRCCIAACCAAAREPHGTLFIVDQVSVPNAVLRALRPDCRVLFYCHFPDLLLAQREVEHTATGSAWPRQGLTTIP